MLDKNVEVYVCVYAHVCVCMSRGWKGGVIYNPPVSLARTPGQMHWAKKYRCWFGVRLGARKNGQVRQVELKVLWVMQVEMSSEHLVAQV